jgi:hypothetical protein
MFRMCEAASVLSLVLTLTTRTTSQAEVTQTRIMTKQEKRDMIMAVRGDYRSVDLAARLIEDALGLGDSEGLLRPTDCTS